MVIVVVAGLGISFGWWKMMKILMIDEGLSLSLCDCSLLCLKLVSLSLIPPLSILSLT